LGAVGAAAACARALRLSETQTAHAISLATSRAAGFMSQFGTETKPLHSGFAASGGVEAALFARAGITAGSETLHGPTGLRTLMVGPDVDTLAESMVGKAEHGQTVTFRDEDVGDPLHILHHGLKIKRFPNCGSVHRALDGLLELREMHALSADDVASIHVRAPAAHLRNLMYEMPETPAEAKFSLEYNLAVGLMRGDVGLENFEPQQISRADIRSLYPIITKDYVEALESDFPTEVHIQTKDGRRFETRRAMPVGSREHPLTDAQILAKFENCARATTSFENGEALAKTFRSLESNMPVRQISSLMT
ncbi:MAG: MmgE/PrpD family protein, partial [Pseudomonadota bacterium]